jgi:hypothetical protein
MPQDHMQYLGKTQAVSGRRDHYIRPRRWDKEWWTSRAYDCRDERAVAGRAAAEVAAH